MNLKILSEHVTDFNTKRVLLLLFTSAFIVLGILLHVEVSKLAVGKYPEITGNFIPRNYSVEFSVAVLILFVFYFIYKAIKGKQRAITFYYWFIYTVCLVIFYLFISLHQVEIIHLIQYSAVAILLGYNIDPKKKLFAVGLILFISTTLGVIDELLQFYIVAPGQKYLDFNDFIVNVLGSISGTLLYYGFTDPPENLTQPRKPFYKTFRFGFLVIVFSLIILFMMTDTIQISPPYNIQRGGIQYVDGQLTVFMERIPGKLGSWQKHFVQGYYYAFNPQEGMLAVFGLCIIFSTFDPRNQKLILNKILK